MTPQWMQRLWDAFCLVSLLGIYPRFIEPKRLTVTNLNFSHPSLNKLKIIQFSDLHFSRHTSSRFLQKLAHAINAQKGDLVVFTGDCLCNGVMEDEERLKAFFNSIKAPHCLAIVGNHDYEKPIGLNAQGDYDTVSKMPELIQGWMRLFKTIALTKRVTPSAKKAAVHPALISLFQETPFKLLYNQSTTVCCKGSSVNIVGLAEHMTGQIDPHTFQKINPAYPTLVLLHNPDGAPFLSSYPSDLILSGHTHGGQINLPWFWQRFTLIENPSFKSGLKQLADKILYINRGVGSSFRFRLFSPPEITVITYD